MSREWFGGSRKTQKEIANILDITQGRVSQIVSGFIGISPDEMLKKDMMSQINILVLREWLSGKLHQGIANICDISRSKVTQIISDFRNKVLEWVMVGITRVKTCFYIWKNRYRVWMNTQMNT